MHGKTGSLPGRGCATGSSNPENRRGRRCPASAVACFSRNDEEMRLVSRVLGTLLGLIRLGTTKSSKCVKGQPSRSTTKSAAQGRPQRPGMPKAKPAQLNADIQLVAMIIFFLPFIPSAFSPLAKKSCLINDGKRKWIRRRGHTPLVQGRSALAGGKGGGCPPCLLTSLFYFENNRLTHHLLWLFPQKKNRRPFQGAAFQTAIIFPDPRRVFKCPSCSGLMPSLSAFSGGPIF